MTKDSSKTDSISTILYIGEDMNFFSRLHDDFKKLQKSESVSICLERRPAPNAHYPLLFKEIWRTKPVAVLLDFASYAQRRDPRGEYLQGLMKLLRQNFQTKVILTLAIHDYLQSPDLVEELLTAGVRFNYIKSIENDLIAHEIQTVLNVKGMEASPQALAMDQIHTELTQVVRVSYATAEFLRVETNVNLQIGQIIHLTKHPFSNRPDRKYLSVKVEEAQEGALYFAYKYAFHLRYINLESEKQIFMDIKFLGESPTPRHTRVLIVDPCLEFIDESLPYLDELNYTLNIQSDYTFAQKTMERFKPHIVVVQNLPPEQIEGLRKLLHPKASLLQFQSDERETLCTPDPLTFSMVEALAQSYRQKIPANTAGKFYFSSHHAGALAKFSHQVTIHAYSESLLYFESKVQFPEYCVLELTAPFKSLLTTVPIPITQEKLKKCQVAVMNYNSEEEVRNIRQRINAFFTKEALLKREKEIEMMAKANAQYIEKKRKGSS